MKQNKQKKKTKLEERKYIIKLLFSVMNNIYMLICINIDYRFNKKFERMLRKSVRDEESSAIISCE